MPKRARSALRRARYSNPLVAGLAASWQITRIADSAAEPKGNQGRPVVLPPGTRTPPAIAGPVVARAINGEAVGFGALRTTTCAVEGRGEAGVALPPRKVAESLSPMASVTGPASNIRPASSMHSGLSTRSSCRLTTFVRRYTGIQRALAPRMGASKRQLRRPPLCAWVPLGPRRALPLPGGPLCWSLLHGPGCKQCKFVITAKKNTDPALAPGPARTR
jgi:hypothetical protein